MAEKKYSLLGEMQHQLQLLQQEYEYEKEMFWDSAHKADVSRKVQQGICWYPVRIGASRYNSLNQLTVDVFRVEGEDVEHNFEYGRPVCFFRLKENGELVYLDCPAAISYVQDNRMVIALSEAQMLAVLNREEGWGVQLYFDDTSYKMMFAALRKVMLANNDRTAYLRDVLLGNLPAGFRDLLPMRFPWLNASQENAVNRVLAAREVAIVHGPPGTGKTTTLVEAVFETLHRENQVLVCAQSNTAVDWISEKLLDRGIPVLRIGNPTRVNDKMLAFTYERRFEAHEDYPELWSLRKAIRELQSRIRGNGAGKREQLRHQLSKLRHRALELEIRIHDDLFREARVIASTLVGAANRLLEHRRFSSLFIDEAAQALEAACWIAISKADRVILAGDHCQLPPTIKCLEALRGGLGDTLMEKVVRRKPETVSLLRMQYRMHEDIMAFPSHWFYHDRLLAAPEVRYRGILDYDNAITWIDTAALDFKEKNVADGTGRINLGEAGLLIRHLRSYMERIGEKRILDEHIDFGIISPYRAQVRYLRQLLYKEPFFRPFRSLLTVHTVDGFQGQERDVVFVSLVRANEEGQIGFLRDLRRMNVAITRARMKLVILGDAVTLARHPFYKALYDYIGKLNHSNEEGV
ncbi:MAG TPA: AAA family ATPase [Candidatus Odoribacter faecigallinarum]|uniref:AAA family ATPase n=1 Tax=Candidatus Odoribacter faecigallinarum TaxID=2838706 RepID=A0A9D1V223_9BACT|nr:AAA family ATPase [Candidatus Odoribacter faecigallinarum]